MCALGRQAERDCAAFRCNVAMCRRKRAIRGVALFTQQVNIPSAENVHILSASSITISDQLGILGSSEFGFDRALGLGTGGDHTGQLGPVLFDVFFRAHLGGAYQQGMAQFRIVVLQVETAEQVVRGQGA